MRVAFYTLGCKVNHYETAAMAELFTAAGHSVVDFSEKADAYVVNTCTVTAVADQKSRQMLSRAHAQCPDALIVAVGCYSEVAKDKVATLPGVDLVLAGHYCGGEWKLPIIGTLYADTNILPRYGWFPSETYVQGLRSVDGIQVYTTQGLGNNSRTVFTGRLNNPPRVTIITLTGELPQSFLE